MSTANSIVSKLLEDDAKEFILSTKFRPELDIFTDNYAVCALWSTLDATYSVNDISDETLWQMKKDCEKFQAENMADLEQGASFEQGGHDFWLTRNGHGTGFWDRPADVWPADVAKRLTDAAHKFGNFEIYVGDDGKIYH